MYQALYRKYRPENFNEVVGQNIIVNTLKNSIKNNKLSHAYLFTGPRGTGKTSIAKILAKTINCLNIKDETPCCNCVNCTQIKNKQFTDIIEIDAASNNGVDEIREIRNKVNLVPTTGKYKVYIIDEVHMLTTGAFNALLKTLEEPPSHVIFILATTEPHKIPMTILSRCQRFDFKKISNESILERLNYIAKEENIDVEQNALLTIASISDGGMRDSVNLLDQVNSYKNGKITLEDVHQVNGSLSDEIKKSFINAILSKNIVEVLKFIDQFSEDGKNLIKVLEEITLVLKNMMLSKISSDYSKNETFNYEEYKNIIEKVNMDEILSIINCFNNNLNNIKMANDTKLAIELLMIKEFYNKEEIKEIKEKNIETKEEKIVLEDKKKLEQKLKVEIKQECIIEQKDNNDEQLKELLEKIKKRRIENTLALFQKKKFTDIKEKIKKLEDYISDERYSKIISLLMDGELKAASEKNLLFVYNTKSSADKFNLEIIDIEETIESLLKENYKVIALENISWEIIKKEFNSKEKEYKYEEENFDHNLLKQKNNNEQDKLVEYFENIIEYE